MPPTHELLATQSTNADAKALADAGAEHLTTVWAHRQTAGRGRLDRSWVSLDGNVFWSVVLRLGACWPASIGQLVPVHALAVLAAVRAQSGCDALTLKWPNDLMLRGRKVAGTLMEAKIRGGRAPEYVVAGTGINVVAHPSAADLRYPATSLHAEGFTTARREPLVAALREQVGEFVERWVRDGFAALRREYLERAHGFGEPVRVSLGSAPDDVLEGIHRGIDADGSLLVELRDGTLRALSSGEILRPC